MLLLLEGLWLAVHGEGGPADCGADFGIARIYIGQKGQSCLKLHLELVENKRLTFDEVILMKLIESLQKIQPKTDTRFSGRKPTAKKWNRVE